MTLSHWALRRIAGKPRSLADAAFKQEVLAPERHYVREPAPMLPGMLDRVTATDPLATLEDQLAIARGGPWTHAATIAYYLRDAQVLPNAVYAGGTRYSYGKGNAVADAKRLLDTGTQRVDRGLLVSTFVTNHWFGDWLLDSNARALFAQQQGLAPIDVIKPRRYDHAARYADIFGLPRVEARHARVGELVVMQDHGMTPHRRARLHELRRRARALPGKRSGHGVFLVRGRQGQLRLLENEAEAIDWARGIGFHIVDAMAQSVDETLAELRDARWVVGVESSAMVHATLVMDPRGALVSIAPPDRFIINMRDYAQGVDLGYALMVAQPGQAGGFYADLGELEATLALAQARFGHGSVGDEAAEG